MSRFAASLNTSLEDEALRHNGKATKSTATSNNAAQSIQNKIMFVGLSVRLAMLLRVALLRRTVELRGLHFYVCAVGIPDLPVQAATSQTGHTRAVSYSFSSAGRTARNRHILKPGNQ